MRLKLHFRARRHSELGMQYGRRANMIKWQDERCDLICSNLQGPIGSFARSSPKRTDAGYHLLGGLGVDRSERDCLSHHGGITMTTHLRTSEASPQTDEGYGRLRNILV